MSFTFALWSSVVPAQAAMAVATPAPCSVSIPSLTYGTATQALTAPATGTYRAWSRLNTSSAANNSYFLQIDGGCPVVVGDIGVAAGVWTWVDYQNAATANKINFALTAGAHTVTMTGREPEVMLDRLILTTDTACVPTGTGDNCASLVATATPIAAPPTTTATSVPVPSASPSPRPTATPVTLHGDITGPSGTPDGHINILDLSYLLGKWGTADAKADISGSAGAPDGLVNVLDLSSLLTGWTG